MWFKHHRCRMLLIAAACVVIAGFGCAKEHGELRDAKRIESVREVPKAQEEMKHEVLLKNEQENSNVAVAHAASDLPSSAAIAQAPIDLPTHPGIAHAASDLPTNDLMAEQAPIVPNLAAANFGPGSGFGPGIGIGGPFGVGFPGSFDGGFDGAWDGFDVPFGPDAGPFFAAGLPLVTDILVSNDRHKCGCRRHEHKRHDCDHRDRCRHHKNKCDDDHKRDDDHHMNGSADDDFNNIIGD